MSFNYSGLAATSTRLINEFGSTVTLSIKTVGTYDPLTGVNTDSYTDTDVIGVKLNFDNSDIDGTLIKKGDFKLLIDGTVTLTVDDRSTINGIEYEIVRQLPLEPGDTRLITTAQCRR